MNELKQLLKRKVIFHCSRRGSENDKKDFDTVHSLEGPLDKDAIPDWVTPTLSKIYKKWYGLRLFQPNHGTEEGFRLFNIDEASKEQKELKSILDENRMMYKENSDYECLDEWLDGLIPIGEVISSGDKYALDTFHKKDDGESPIIFLNHEAYYGDCCDPETMEVVAKDAIDLLSKILKDPLRYVASHWVGGDMAEQWYPESITIA